MFYFSRSFSPYVCNQTLWHYVQIKAINRIDWLNKPFLIKKTLRHWFLSIHLHIFWVFSRNTEKFILIPQGDILENFPRRSLNSTRCPMSCSFKAWRQRDVLFHYFGLEPYNERKHGLSLSLFTASDGRDEKIYIYDHFQKKESLTGASTRRQL